MARRCFILVLCVAALHVAVHAQSPPPSGPIVTAQTPHLTLMAVASDGQVTPGKGFSLIFDVTPRRNIHLYAPGKHAYQVVKVNIDPRPWLRLHAANYPPSEVYHFKPLDERVAVYSKPFQLVQHLTILSTPAANKALAGQRQVTIAGRLDYQACDDTVCYRPQSVPVSWTLELHRSPDR